LHPWKHPEQSSDHGDVAADLGFVLDASRGGAAAAAAAAAAAVHLVPLFLDGWTGVAAAASDLLGAVLMPYEDAAID